MPSRKMPFRAKHRSHFKNPLKHADTELFIKLRALRQKRLSAEIIDSEKIRSPFGCRPQNFWRLDADKTHITHRLRVSGNDRVVYAKNGSHRFVSQSQRAIIKKRWQFNFQFPLA